MAGTIKNCPVCGKLYAETGLKMCRDCFDKQQDKEKEVVEFVRENPKSTIVDIVEATGATEGMIKRLIREGRFIQVGVKMTYPCEKCGEPIITGKLCQQCQEKVRRELQATSAKIVATRQMNMGRGTGMHSKDMRK